MFNFLSLMMSFVASTAGVNGPNLDTLAIVHCAQSVEEATCRTVRSQTAGVVKDDLSPAAGVP